MTTSILLNVGAFVVGLIFGFWWRRRSDETDRALMKKITRQLDEVAARVLAERDARVPPDDPKPPA